MMPLMRSSRGFTLVEILAAVAILALLAAIAIPSYQDYVLRSNRASAQRMMTTIANRQAQYLVDAREYADDIGAGGLNISNLDDWACVADCTDGNYTIAVTLDAGPPPTFTITATPIGRQVKDGVLTLTSTGDRERTVGGVPHDW